MPLSVIELQTINGLNPFTFKTTAAAYLKVDKHYSGNYTDYIFISTSLMPQYNAHAIFAEILKPNRTLSPNLIN